MLFKYLNVSLSMRLVSYMENLTFLTLSAACSSNCIEAARTMPPTVKANAPTIPRATKPVNLSDLNK